MISLNFSKLYKDPRIDEPCTIAIPFSEGAFFSCDNFSVKNEKKEAVPCQHTVTARWIDGSIKWLFTRFSATLPGYQDATYFLDTCDKGADFENMKNISYNSLIIDTGKIKVSLKPGKNSIFEYISFGEKVYTSENISGPQLVVDDNVVCDFETTSFKITETGPVATVVRGTGFHTSAAGSKYQLDLTLTFFAGKPYFEFAYKFTNTTDSPVKIHSLKVSFNTDFDKGESCVATSNYKTHYHTSETAEGVSKVIDSDYLIYDANEHMSETFYGTFFADSSDGETGVTITHYQAYQNYPKALSASYKGIDAMIVPPDVEEIIFQSGMAREQKMLFHFHESSDDMYEINRISTIYQMPDVPVISPDIYQDADVFENIYYDNKNPDFERYITGKADGHARCYGMLNWGDGPDPGYTSQGRGNGLLVWTNNEYDFPHQNALLFSRTGNRRFLDYMLVSARHWLDVDICHYSSDPLLIDGQWMHTNNHCLNSKIVCSHQWVEGLLDYYHFTGDEYALNSAIKIGENVLRLLDTPMFHHKGDINARETGWALRTLVSLYKETYDNKWLAKCDWIVGHFKEWEYTYGHWLAPYMDVVAIRVPFMIAIASCSLMRYYRINHSEEIKDMIIRAVDDVIENCYMDNGLFLYKELPSLSRLGNNTIILEALTYACELTGNKDYLKYGVTTFKTTISGDSKGSGGAKRHVEDTVIVPGPGPKNFAQSHLPLTIFYKAASENNIEL